jgi:hypothetical protein
MHRGGFVPDLDRLGAAPVGAFNIRPDPKARALESSPALVRFENALALS